MQLDTNDPTSTVEYDIPFVTNQTYKRFKSLCEAKLNFISPYVIQVIYIGIPLDVTLNTSIREATYWYTSLCEATYLSVYLLM